jgi:hypothetical protein
MDCIDETVASLTGRLLPPTMIGISVNITTCRGHVAMGEYAMSVVAGSGDSIPHE